MDKQPFSYVIQRLKSIGVTDAILLNESNWINHPHGGGWVDKRSYIHRNVYVGESAIVFGDKTALRGGSVGENAIVGNNVTTEGNPSIRGIAIVKDAHIKGHVTISGNAKIYADNNTNNGIVNILGDDLVIRNVEITTDIDGWGVKNMRIASQADYEIYKKSLVEESKKLTKNLLEGNFTEAKDQFKALLEAKIKDKIKDKKKSISKKFGDGKEE